MSKNRMHEQAPSETASPSVPSSTMSPLATQTDSPNPSAPPLSPAPPAALTTRLNEQLKDLRLPTFREQFQTLAEQALYGAENAYAMLMAGFTTVQSIGAPSDLPLRAAIASGRLPGPRLLTAVSPPKLRLLKTCVPAWQRCQSSTRNGRSSCRYGRAS